MDSVDMEGRSGSFMASLRGGLGHQECVLELMRQVGCVCVCVVMCGICVCGICEYGICVWRYVWL